MISKTRASGSIGRCWSTSLSKTEFHVLNFFQFNEQLESARELETNQAQMRGQIQEAQKHVSKTGVLVTHLLLSYHLASLSYCTEKV